MKKPKWLNNEIEAVFNWKIRAYEHFRITKLTLKEKKKNV